MVWRKQLILTLLERDLPRWGVRVPAVALHRFWTMLAHYHGQTWNAAEHARALGVNESTCRRYLDLLTDALMVRQLQPWYANLKKRQVKSPQNLYSWQRSPVPVSETRGRRSTACPSQGQRTIDSSLLA